MLLDMPRSAVDAEIEDYLAHGARLSTRQVYGAAAGRRVVGAMETEPDRYMGMTLDQARHYARYGGSSRLARSRVR